MRWLVAFLLLTTSGLYAQKLLPGFESDLIESVWIDTELKNSPREYYIKKYEYNKDSVKLLRLPTTIHYLLEDGVLRQVQFRQEDKTIKSHHFDSYGRIIMQERFGFNENMPKIVYNYDDKERQASETVFRLGDRVHSKVVVTYNAQNQMISKEEYRGKSKLDRFWRYHYNEHNDLVLDQYFDTPGASGSGSIAADISASDSTYFQYAYDEQDRKISRLNYRGKILEARSDYAYYPDSAVEQTTFYRFDGKPKERHLQVKMDSLRVLVKGFFSNGDTSKFRSRFQEIYLYGDLIEYESRTMRGTYVDRYTTFYEYDELGNWIIKTTYSNGLVVKKEERTILY